MWQTVAVLGIVAVVLVYVIRHYVNVFRADVPTCSGCGGGCSCSGSPKGGGATTCDAGAPAEKS